MYSLLPLSDIHGEQSTITIMYYPQQPPHSHPLPQGIRTGHAAPATLSGGGWALKEGQRRRAAIEGEVILSWQHSALWLWMYRVVTSNLPWINSTCAWPRMKERKRTFWIVRTFYWISIWHWMGLEEEDCPLNQAEFPYAFHLSIAPSWASVQEWKIGIFSTTRPQMTTSCSEAETNKQHPLLFFKYTKHLIPQDLCTCHFLCLGGLPQKYLYGLPDSVPHCILTLKSPSQWVLLWAFNWNFYQPPNTLFLPSLLYFYPIALKTIEHSVLYICLFLLLSPLAWM